MKIHIDGEIIAECSHVVGRWNGFIEPVFTKEQMLFVQSECVRLGWDSEVEEGLPAHLAGWTDLGNDEWLCEGWVWEEVR